MSDAPLPRIAILDERVARKIAAGEVIDRPAAIVRELLDNSLDARASSIEVAIERGGVDAIRVIDDGHGMDRRNIELSVHPHATSKIRSFEDLERAGTLGFRGEAMASVAAVSRLSIISGVDPDRASYRLDTDAEGHTNLQVDRAIKGTIVTARDLFYALPARRKSLRHRSAETNQCRAIFIEKALAFPEIAMRFGVDRTTKLALPADSPTARIVTIYPDLQQRLHLLKRSGDGFDIVAIVADPDLQRRDRALIQIWLNRRRIREFSLMQAMDYAFSSAMPGGLHPVAFLFIEIDPELVDFNIHPAKREARIRGLQDIRRQVITLLQHFLTAYERKISGTAPEARSLFAKSYRLPDLYVGERAGSLQMTREIVDRVIAEKRHATEEADGAQGGRVQTHRFHYLGQLFGLFLVVEVANRVLIIDQHAADEKVLYERYSQSKEVQRLLIPLRIETNEEQDGLLTRLSDEWRSSGIELERAKAGLWHIVAVPSALADDERSLGGAMDDLLEAPEGVESAIHRFYARMACRAAIKDGSSIDNETALDLIRDTLLLTDGRCPHGRPLWFELTRDELARFVGRT